jgi:hypothetical protein
MKHSFKSKWPKALGIILTVGGLSLLSGCHKSPEERITKISEKIADKLDFTDQQKVLLGDITTELKIHARRFQSNAPSPRLRQSQNQRSHQGPASPHGLKS